MKNVMVYIHPEKRVVEKRYMMEKLIRLQIDNSLELGWNSKDILLVTNFPYSHQGVTAMQVSDVYFCDFDPVSTKIPVISHLLDMGLPDDTYWYHDWDAYENEKIDLSLSVPVGLTDYGWSTKWCLGSFFFTPEAKDFFSQLTDQIYKERWGDERVLTGMTKRGEIDGYTKLNITYNFGMRNIDLNYKLADKPLRVLHFHPFYKDSKLPDSTLNMFMYGKNPIGKPLMSERLIHLFHSYEIR